MTTTDIYNDYHYHFGKDIVFPTELWVWLAVYFGSLAIAGCASLYVYRYVSNARFIKRAHSQRVFIVRSDPDYDMGEEIISFIKATASRPFRIISDTDGTQQSHTITFRRFMKRLMNTDEELYIMGEHNYNWQYENYIYLANQLSVPVAILEFKREGVEFSNDYWLDSRTGSTIIL